MLFEVIREEGTGKREEAGGRGQGAGEKFSSFFFLLNSWLLNSCMTTYAII